VAATQAAPALLCDMLQCILCALENFDLAFGPIIAVNELRKLGDMFVIEMK
jgi:hypothetical protein